MQTTDMQTFLTGIALGESPRWHDGRLWFSDWGAGEIVAAGPDGTREVVVNGQALPFCSRAASSRRGSWRW
jgi:sugar lactone lactonase YvrE